MARKTNVVINGIEYYRLRKTIGKDKKGNPVRKPFYGKSKKDAEAKYAQWIKETSQGLKITSKQSLSMTMDIWLWNIEYYSGNAETTFERYEGIYRNYIADSDIGRIILDDLDKVIIQNHYNKLFEDDKSYSQIKNLNKLLRKFLTYCIEERHLLANPCAGIKLDAYRPELDIIDIDDFDDEGEFETLPEEDLKKLEEIKNIKLRVLVKLMLGTGIRLGEALGLDEADIKDMVVYVTKQLKLVKVFSSPTKYKYELKITPLKTKKSKRKVPIPSGLKNDLKELRRLKAAEQLKLGELYKENTLLFPSETGEYLDKSNLTRAWKRALKKANIPYKKLHALRHTYATQLIKNGVDLPYCVQTAWPCNHQNHRDICSYN